MIDRPIIKKCLKIVKIAAKTTACLSTVYVLVVGSWHLDLVLTARINNALDFDEISSYGAQELEYPGYRNDKPFIVSISNSFSNSSRKKVIEGLEYVDEVVHGVKFVIVLGDSEGADIKIEPDTEMKEAGVAFPYGKGCGKIYINDKTFNPMGVKATVAHEVGHLLGLEHSKSLRSLMYPVISRRGFSQQDIDNLNDLWPANENELTQ